MDLFTLKIGFFYALNHLFRWFPQPRSWQKTETCTSYETNEAGDTVIFHCHKGKLLITAITPSLFRVLFVRDRDPEYVTFSVSYKETVPVKTEEKNRFLHIKAASRPGIEVLFDLNTTGISFSFHNQMLHSETRAASFKKNWVSSVKIAPVKERYLGFGQKTGPLFKNNQKLKMWNTDDPRLSPNSDPVYQSCPFMIGVRDNGFSHGIFFDNPGYSLFRMGKAKTSTKAFYAAREAPLCYYVIGGPTLKDVIENFTLLTGRYPLPPRWVLGHHHSRWVNEESEEGIKTLAAEFREHKIPCDVLHIDIGHMRGFRCFTWNPVTFPNPGKMVEDLHNKQFKVVVITDPGIKKDREYHVYKEGVEKGYFCTDKKDRIYHASVWPGKCGFVDFSNPEARKWWGSLYEFYTSTGINGFWNDMNEPSLFYTLERTLPGTVIHKGGNEIPQMSHRQMHNAYGLLMARATAEGLDTLQPGMRKFLFCRSSFAGIQRYASTWTGDNRSHWSHIRLSLSMILNMGLSGQPMTGPDIGGFWGNTTPELMCRWIQVGAFYPFCRNHTSLASKPQEVWKFNSETLAISRNYITLRYTLLPYLYTYLWESCETGIPLMRPLFLDYPSDPQCMDPEVCETEFLSGPFFLVAPVLSPGTGKRNVYLPRGDDWYDMKTCSLYNGGNTIEYDAPIDTMPVFIKAGAVVPMSPPVMTTDETENREIIFSVYEAEKISGTLYIDDGKSLQYKKGNYSLLLCQGKSLSGRIIVQCRRIKGDLHPVLAGHPYITFHIHFIRQVEKINTLTLDGMPLQETGESGTGWRFSGKSLHITIKEVDFPFTLEVQYKA